MPVEQLPHRFVDALERVTGFASRHLFDQSASTLRWYYVLLTSGFVLYQAALPIILGDTDMWYHLAGGRYFWETHTVPDTAYFSFAASDREWVAYFWGFQALIYPVFDAFGYQGLVVLRAALFGLCLLAIGGFIRRSNDNRWGWAAVVLVISYFILMDARAYQLRPHLVSYALIPTFLLILEFKRRWLPALPLLCVAWVNLHGVEWVIGAAIVGAYALELVVKRGQSGHGLPWQELKWMLACLPALFVNPFGWQIVTAPFAIPDGLTELISELRPLSPANFFTLYVGAQGIGTVTLLTGLTLFGLAALAHQLMSRQVRVSHMVLAICALILVTRGNRFVFEWALLTLPLIGSLLPSLRIRRVSLELAPLPIVLAIALLTAPLVIIGERTLSRDFRYPFHSEGLPTGVVTFLRKHKAKGNLLISPNYGGYINWALNPQIKIHSDMEFPPFTATDALRIGLVLRGNTEAIAKFSSTHNVDFAAIRVGRAKQGKQIAEQLGLVPVFFDDGFVLYASTERQPSIASNRLSAVNPYDLLDRGEDPEAHLDALLSLLEQWPSSRRLNHAVTRLLLDKERYAEAKPIAARFARLYPDDPNSEYLVGNLEERTDNFDAAIQHYMKSMKYADASFQKVLYTHIGTNHYLAKRFEKAYAAFKQGINPFSAIPDPETMFQYAFVAAATGHFNHSQRLLDALLWSTPEIQAELRAKAQSLLETVTSPSE